MANEANGTRAGSTPAAGTSWEKQPSYSSAGSAPLTADQLAGELVFSLLRKLRVMSLPEALENLAGECPEQAPGLLAASLALQLRGSAAATKAVATRRAGGGRVGNAENNGRKGGN